MTKSEIIRNEWRILSDEKKVSFVTACTKSVIRNKKMRVSELDEIINVCMVDVLLILDVDSIQKINKKRNEQSKPDITLVSLIYKGCTRGIEKFVYSENKHGAENVTKTMVTNDGLLNPLDADNVQNKSKKSFELTPLEELEQKEFVSNLSDVDRIVFKKRLMGYTEREIAVDLGVTKNAIHKRIARIRNIYTGYSEN